MEFVEGSIVSPQSLILFTLALGGIAATIAGGPSARAQEPGATAFARSIRTYDDAVERARQLSTASFRPSPPLPADLATMEYDDYRMIGIERKFAIWRQSNRPFWIETFHRGYVYKDQVVLNAIGPEETVPIPYDPKMFQFRGPLAGMTPPDDLGFAGWRALGKFPGGKYVDEMLVFAGASYFRARLNERPYGTSARGLAIDAGMNKEEEFPVFREFWFVEPQPGDHAFVAIAELDSPSVAGAYRFTMTPLSGVTEIEVEATLFFRRTPEKVALAPLTSMWMWGDGLAGPEGDHRPTVHDSDGLLIERKDGSWFWRALSRQSYPSLVRWDYPQGIRGFGLIQRDRDYEHYLDDEAKYHLRPSVWVEPHTGFDAGAIELFEMASHHEGLDNIGAYWIPAQPIVPGEPVRMSYRVSFFDGDVERQQVARATETRIQRGNKGEPILLEIDFSGGELATLGEDPRVDLLTISSSLVESRIVKRENGDRTVMLKVQPEDVPAIGLEATIRVGDRTISETWSYLCAVEAPPVSLPPWRLKELEAAAKAGDQKQEPAKAGDQKHEPTDAGDAKQESEQTVAPKDEKEEARP